MTSVRQLVRGHSLRRLPAWGIVAEAFASARGQPVASAIAVLVVTGLCSTVLLTTGQAVGAEREVLASIDTAGTRSVVVRANSDAGLDTMVLDRLTGVEGLAWVGAFGPASDVRNTAFPGGTAVPLRTLHTTDLRPLALEPADGPPGVPIAYASAAALAGLGMVDGVGSAAGAEGPGYAISGPIAVPDYLSVLEPLAVAPQPAGGLAAPVSVLVVVAARASLVAPLSQVVLSMLGIDDVTGVSLTTSQQLAALRGVVEGQLRTFGGELVGGVFVLAAVLEAAIFSGIVLARRRDFGRRRALGASQRFVAALVVSQVSFLSGIGAGLGIVLAAVALRVSGDPLPGPEFLAAVAVLCVGTGTAASLVPAWVAARRDPLRELRVP